MKFQTAAYKAAELNLVKFIDTSRSNIPFGPIHWDAMYWEVPKKSRASSGRKIERIWFNANFATKTTAKNAEPFPEPFSSFVKSFICYRESHAKKGLATLDHMVAIRAQRYLFEALRDRGNTPTALVPADFDNAINLCLQSEQHSSAYRIGIKLSEIAKLLDKHRLVPIRIDWKNPVPRNSDTSGAIGARVGKEFNEHRNRKLPSEEVMNALADISNRKDLEDRDLLRQRAIDLLVCGGFRINELLTIPRECWREEQLKDTNNVPLLDQNGKPAVRCGIRYIPEKGGHTETQTKWLPTVMVDVAKRAINDIQRITEPFWAIAQFITSNPNRTLLPEPWHSMPPGSLFSMDEVAQIVGLTNHTSARLFVKTANLPLVKKQGKERLIQAIAKSDLEFYLALQSEQQDIFPQGQGHYGLSECLFVVGINFLGSQRGTLNGTATLLTDGQISDYIVGRSMGLSIFDRLGYYAKNGEPLTITSHQFRHWLNTLANEGGLSQLEIARWMGRKDVRQNTAYNHMTGVQLAASIHKKLQNIEIKGLMQDTAIRIKDPVRREEFISSLTTTAHVTDLGICLHDWSALPCPKHRSCMTCDEHLVDKGNEDQKARALVLKQDTEVLLNLAESAEQEQAYGVNNWLEHQKIALSRLDTIITLHNDQNIPDGTLIHLGDSKPSISAETE
ncbi:hypothetical protein [Aquitalea sp. ASV11]|uniref:hypothetical protein n=1 Tax=Aquitalea sp. ASV11 TaxID=2795103 RepID=UPI0018EA8F94|nr:hypothetical protein [Aquitalea sp. ASV11]